MVKVSVQKYNRAYMTPLGLHSYKLNDPSIELFYHPAVYYATVFLTYSFVSAFVYLCQNIDNVKEALESFKILAGGAKVGICSFIVAFQMRKIKTLHIQLQEHVDNCNKIVDCLYFHLNLALPHFVVMNSGKIFVSHV